MFAATSGYRNDGDAGLMHVGVRYYDAQVGRFLTRDTVLSEHPYLYCEHEPVSRVDPSGHWRLSITLGGILGVAWFSGWADIGIAIDHHFHIGFVGHLGGTDSGGFSGPGHGGGIGIGGSFGFSIGIDTGVVNTGSDNGWSTNFFGGLNQGVNCSVGWDLLSGWPNGFSTWPFKVGSGPTYGIGIYSGPQIGFTRQIY
jgi:RHS repeat-associated protein